MMPLADIVALSTSVSNHWSRKSAALMVMSWTRLYWSLAGRRLEAPAEVDARSLSSRGVEATSGRAAPSTRIGLTKRAMSTIVLRVLVVGLGVARRVARRSRGACGA